MYDLIPDHSMLPLPDTFISRDDFQSIVEDILSSLVLRPNRVSIGDYETHCEEVIKSYHINFENLGGPPDLADIVSDILNDNWEKTLKLGALDFYHGEGMPGYNSFLRYEKLDEDADDSDCIAMLAEMWFNDYEMDDTKNLDDYIAEILDEHKLAYQNTLSELVNTKDGEVVLMNDCQTILFPEWHIHMMISRGGEHSYTAEEIKRLLSVLIIRRR